MNMLFWKSIFKSYMRSYYEFFNSDFSGILFLDDA